MRRTEALLIFLILVAVGISNSFTNYQALVDDRGTTPEVRAIPDDLHSTEGPTSDELTPSIDDEGSDAHVFWMRDGWYYKKFDRFGNALTKEKQINSDVVSPFISEKVVDIGSNQDIHFVWVPGGYSGDVHYVKYDSSGNVVITEIDNSDDEPQVVDELEDNPRIRRWFE